MIVCKQCGHHNEDSDTFCGSCGKFLEWTGENHLRHTKFIALRDDRPAQEVRRE